MEHTRPSKLAPRQDMGSSLSQFRIFCWNPPSPQLTLQLLHADHSDHDATAWVLDYKKRKQKIRMAGTGTLDALGLGGVMQ